ncbi:Receptor-like protein 7 [Citrus sinensis]|uniref:Receptor-like protein 7 n=1 Tax=Citrus sinensis TaxID=2711 RepID=A0ACB8P144_CITSI|nr:Receptor-like protein 7 [Citrus sinensis]
MLGTGIKVNSSLPNLRRLDISACNASEFPDIFTTANQLETLDLSHNKIHGIIEQLPWENVELLDLRSNLLQGSLRVLPPFLQFFSVSQNKLTGPSSSCNLSSVVYIDSSNNSLSVVIPENLVNSTLNVLDLRMNKLRGSIPQTFPEDCNFNNLYLNGNQLEGPLPPSLVSCGYLNALDVENNKINVKFPDWSADLPELQVLIL